jgi:hypothetical protein
MVNNIHVIQSTANAIKAALNDPGLAWEYMKQLVQQVDNVLN